MKADGISPTDLLGSELAQAGKPTKSVNRVKRNIALLTRTVKKNVDRPGRTPKPIASALAEGKSLDDFLI